MNRPHRCAPSCLWSCAAADTNLEGRTFVTWFWQIFAAACSRGENLPRPPRRRFAGDFARLLKILSRLAPSNLRQSSRREPGATPLRLRELDLDGVAPGYQGRACSSIPRLQLGVHCRDTEI
jgi:hypothetical protein